MLKKLAILGAGGHGKVVADAALLGHWTEVLFFDDKASWDADFRWKISGSYQDMLNSLDDFEGIIVGIGNNKIRLEKTRELINAKASIVSVAHPSATISPFSRISQGSLICAGAIVNVDASIGAACIINTRASVDHDCTIKDGAHIAPGVSIAGNVFVGERTWIGIGAIVREGTSIGSDVMVGAQAAILEDVPNGHLAVGVPAKSLRK